MIIKENWYDGIAQRGIRRSYFYWTNWANEEHIKSKKKKRKKERKNANS